jgi:3-hydroxyacyl-[acyl-carrier protein] dehydratase/trans-2-decenoyl-[acyl-carrier protein] isomerase
MVLPSVRKLEYVVELRKVIRRKFTLGVGDGWLKADGETIYTAKDLRVGLFQADAPAGA